MQCAAVSVTEQTGKPQFRYDRTAKALAATEDQTGHDQDTMAAPAHRHSPRDGCHLWRLRSRRTRDQAAEPPGSVRSMKTSTVSGLTQSKLGPTPKTPFQPATGKTRQAGNVDGHVGFEQLICRRCRRAMRLQTLSLLRSCQRMQHCESMSA